MTAEAPPSKRRNPWIVGTILVVVVAGALWLGRGFAARWTNAQALRCLDGSPSVALEWLRWSSWFAPALGETDLLRAKAYRHLNRSADLYAASIESARSNGANQEQLKRESRLQAIESGAADSGGQQELIGLISAGESPRDVCTAFVFGYLHRQDLDSATRVLDAWGQDYAGDPHIEYVRGVFRRSSGENTQAESAFQRALAKPDGHELAALAWARLYEQQQQLPQALERWFHAARSYPASDEAHLGLAQLLRKLGRVADARIVLAPRLAQPTPTREILLEASEIEFELGEYQNSNRILHAVHFNEASPLRELLTQNLGLGISGKATQPSLSLPRLRVIATALAFGNTQPIAEWLFQEVDSTQSRIQRRNDLRIRLDQNPQDIAASQELNRLIASTTADRKANNTMGSSDSPPTNAPPSLYVQHCAACHGTNGDGTGPAARHLDPRPRDFRHDRFRLVSTQNGLPSVDDVTLVIRQGMPGTSMPAFQLSADELRQLAETVLAFRKEGVREQLAQIDGQENAARADEELADLVQRQTTPSAPQPVPGFEKSPDAATLARGREVFQQMGCHKCHDPGLDSHDRLFFDNNGAPGLARDLATDPFKGGIDRRAIYLRLRLGMPGTAHPAAATASDEQLVDLVHYCRSLTQTSTNPLTNHQRGLRTCSVQTDSGVASEINR